MACRGLPTIRQYSPAKLNRTHVGPRCRGDGGGGGRGRREGEGRRNELERKYMCEVWRLLHGVLARKVVREEAASSFVNKRIEDAHPRTHPDTHLRTSTNTSTFRHPHTHIHTPRNTHTPTPSHTHTPTPGHTHPPSLIPPMHPCTQLDPQYM